MNLVKEVTVETAIGEGFKLVDVRTPTEFEEFHIPGAENVPLLGDEERAKVSEVYYTKGEREARFLALRLAGPRLYRIVEEVRRLKKKHRQVAVYCWRGGMRSLAVCTICNLAGLDVSRLKGGYRAFRRFALRRMEELLEGKEVVVIYGPTGTGKTRMIQALSQMGYPAINLEALAGHRGSVFGGIGLKQPSQKMFDSLLWLELERLKASTYIVVEGESRKVGRLFIPDALWKRMERGRNILITAPLNVRVELSLREYLSADASPDIYLEALGRVRKLLGEHRFTYIKNLIAGERYEEAVKELILGYYDPLYRNSTPPVEFSFKVTSPEEGVEKLRELLDSLYGEGGACAGRTGKVLAGAEG